MGSVWRYRNIGNPMEPFYVYEIIDVEEDEEVEIAMGRTIEVKRGTMEMKKYEIIPQGRRNEIWVNLFIIFTV